MKRYLAATTALGLVLGLHANQAAADSITINNVQFSNGSDNVTIGATPTAAELLAHPGENSANDNTSSGQLVMTGTDTTTSTAVTLNVWCVDLFHTINLGSGQNLSFTQAAWNSGDATDNATPHANALTATEVAEMAGLMQIGNGVLQGAALGADNSAFGVSGANKTEWSAAIQLAIWDVEYKDNFTVSESGLGDATTQTIYNKLVAAAFLSTLNGTNATGLFAVGGQQSFAFDTTSTTLVPEPGSLALIGSALVGLGWLRRRRKTV